MPDITLQPRGIAGANGLNLYTDTVNPLPEDGRDNETWLNTRSLTLFKKEAGTWNAKASLAPGAPKAGTPGAPGNTIYSDEGPPSTQLGRSGDFYIQKSGGIGISIYGPKAGAAWPDPVAIVSLVVGAGAPDNGIGIDGQVYIDAIGLQFYGPKAGGVWPAGHTMVGTMGPRGRSGLNYTWSASTSGDPGTGKILANNATFGSITAINISETDADANAVSALLATWSASTNSVKGTLRIENPAFPTNFRDFNVTALSDAGTYDALTVVPVASGGSFTAGDALVVRFSRAGDAGANGTGTGTVTTSGSVADNTVALFNGPSGTSIKSAGAQLPATFIASGSSHTGGLVPDPGSTAGTTRFLREDATWVAVQTAIVVGRRAVSLSTDTIIASDKGKVLEITSASAVALSATAAATLGSGFYCWIKNTGGAVATLDPNSSETVDGLTSIKVYSESFFLWTDGTAWYTAERQRGWIAGIVGSVSSGTSALTLTTGFGDAEIRDVELLFANAVMSTSTTTNIYGQVAGSSVVHDFDYNSKSGTTITGFSSSGAFTALSASPATAAAISGRVLFRNANSAAASAEYISSYPGFLRAGVMSPTTPGAYSGVNISPNAGTINSLSYEVRVYRP